jgi:inorganic triphosphatase YgiF
MAVEVETKLQVPPGFAVPDLTGLAAAAAVVELEPLALRATYWDTEDLRLAREGITLRHRTGEGDPRWTLKLPDTGDGSSLAREELHVAGGPRAVPEELRDLVTAVVRTAVLQPVATLRTARRVLHLLGDDGTALVELVDDRVDVVSGRQVRDRFRELEVELLRDTRVARAAQAAAVSRLVAAGASQGPQTSKLVRALGERATTPHDLPDAPHVAKGSAAGDLVVAALRDGLARLVAADPRVRLRHDDAVHELRVSCRRLRSDLRSFGPLLADDRVPLLRQELKALADEAGAARDLEVLRARLRDTAAADPVAPLDAAALQRLDDLLAAQEEVALDEAHAALRAPRYLALLDLLTDVATAPVLAEVAGSGARDVLPEEVAAVWKRLRKRVARLEPLGDDDAWHEARMPAKQVRYACEAATSALGKKAARAAKAATRVQTLLGEHQDAAVAAERVLALAAEHPDDHALVVTCARLAERERAAIHALRAQLPAIWRKAEKVSPERW